MARDLNILVLCASSQSIKNYKALIILRFFCQSAFNKLPFCKYMTNINIYYAGIDIKDSDIPINALKSIILLQIVCKYLIMRRKV